MVGNGTSWQSWDRIGIVASSACAVHCAVLPFAVAALPFVGLQHLGDERLEWTMVLLTAVVGLVGHARAYRFNHRHLAPALIFIAGLLLVVGARLFLETHRLGPWALVIGGGLAAASHWANLRSCRCCVADCPDVVQASEPTGPSRA